MNLRIDTVLKTLVIALSAMLIVSVISFLGTQRDLRTLQDTWAEFSEERSEKARYFNALSRDLGYGGMIHGFKNFLLREDEGAFATALRRIHAAQSSLDNYRILELDPHEAYALGNVRIMLDAYEANLETARLLIEDGAGIAQLDKYVFVDDSAALQGLDTLAEATFSDSGEQASERNRSLLLNKLRRRLGYGGMIHRFKNYVIRGDRDLLSPLAEDFTAVFRLIGELRTSGQSDAEAAALDRIEGVVAQYESNLEVVTAGHADGKPPREIDSLVKVDDDPALTGLSMLIREIVKREEARAHAVTTKIMQMEDVLFAAAAVTAVLLIAISVALVWLIGRQIVTPISEITDAMNRLAAGSLDIAIPRMHQKNEIGDMGKALAVFRDAAVQQEQDRMALERAKKEADSANAAKTEFLSSMSHELRTPLNAILGFSQVLENDPRQPLTERQAESVRQIHRSGEHLLNLIDQVLDLARIESGKLTLSIETVGVDSVLSECLTMAGFMAESNGITIETDDRAETADDYVLADRTRFRQVLLNLISNAIKYNKEGGSVTIACEPRPGEKYRVSVTDTGIGIPNHLQGQIFSRFDRLGAETSSIEGTGIGLAITNDLVEMMDGAMDFTSAEGKGSTFWFELPVAAKPADGVAIEISPANRFDDAEIDHASIAGKLLYVEDNPNNLRLMEMVLDSFENLNLETAHTGEIGIEIARSFRPNLIFMDLNLPGMDGFEALGRMRQEDAIKDIPVVAVSAHAMDRDIRRARAAGFDDYITKPFRVAEVVNVLHRFLSNSDAARAPAGDPVPAARDVELQAEKYDVLDAEDVGKIIETAKVFPPEYVDILGRQASSLPILIADIRRAAAAEDAAAAEHTAHTLKTNSATFGARELWRLAQEAETSAGAESLETTLRLVDEMTPEYDRVAPAIDRLMSDLADAVEQR